MWPQPGGLRHAHADSPNTAWRNLSFRGYADHMAMPEFAAGSEELLALAVQKQTAVMCAETVPCHAMPWHGMALSSLSHRRHAHRAQHRRRRHPEFIALRTAPPKALRPCRGYTDYISANGRIRAGWWSIVVWRAILTWTRYRPGGDAILPQLEHHAASSCGHPSACQPSARSKRAARAVRMHWPARGRNARSRRAIPAGRGRASRRRSDTRDQLASVQSAATDGPHAYDGRPPQRDTRQPTAAPCSVGCLTQLACRVS
ncbi:MAG: DUF488 family protein [Ktedonobacterales bacterium]